MTIFLAWFEWDPPRFIFTLPIINHPIAWYGVCFAFGFILGFLIILPIIRNYLARANTISPRDIASWPQICKTLRLVSNDKKHPLYTFYQKLPQKTQQKLSELKLNQEPCEKTQSDVLKAINDSYRSLGRQELQAMFPNGLRTLKEISLFLADRLTWFIVIGTVVGARLGHVFFYEWHRYQHSPLDIFKVWEGGLASHGGTIGVMLALFLYQRNIRPQFPELTFIRLLDIISIPTAMTAVWIRLGNFMNQEIVGPATTVPWAIIFANPLETEGGLPRHPAQLYEAACYLITFITLFSIWKFKGLQLKPGAFVGLFMIMVFGSRFLIEFVKIPQGSMIDESLLLTGQYLSIPFILLGCAFLLIPRKKACACLA